MLINKLFVMSSKPEVTKAQVHAFLMGSNPMEHIIKIEGDYNTLLGISPSIVYNKLKELGYSVNDLAFEKRSP